MLIAVGIGEIRIGKPDDVLQTLLGSCVGILIYDPQRLIAGLAHVQLPGELPTASENDATCNNPIEVSHSSKLTRLRTKRQLGKYADTAIPELVEQLSRSNASIQSLEAHLFGGADMFSVRRKPSIGQLNIDFVERWLAAYDIPIQSRQVGGTQARRVVFTVASGEMDVQTLTPPPPSIRGQQAGQPDSCTGGSLK